MSLQDPLQCLKILFRLHSGRLLSYSKKGKSGKMTICCHSLSFFVTRCHLLPLFAPRCHSLSLIVPLVVNRCHSMYQSSVFNLVREINMLREEINRALSKGMSNIYLKVTIEEKNWHSQNFNFLSLKNVSPDQFSGAPAYEDIIEF